MRGTARWFIGVMAGAPGVAPAQDSLPPWQGGITFSIGQPPRTRWHTVGSIGGDWRDPGRLRPVAQAGLGASWAVGNPVAGLLSFSVEGFAGMRSEQSEVGLRAMAVSNTFGLLAGMEWGSRGRGLHPLVGVRHPVRRGGVFGGGTLLRLEAALWSGDALRIGLTVPLFQPTAGRVRPRRSEVSMPVRYLAHRSRPPELETALVEVMGEVRRLALRMQDLVVPPLDLGGGPPVASAARLVRRLRDSASAADRVWTDLGVDRTVEAYHALLERAFSLAESGRPLAPGETTALGRGLAAQGRLELLEHLLHPWNRLLGQRKSANAFEVLAVHARGNFARVVASMEGFTPAREAAVRWVFEEWVEAIGAAQVRALADWRDSRLVWLPLQFGLRPRDHDTQVELDVVIEAAVGRRFTDGNTIYYVINEQFQVEVTRSILSARDYHVLWIHDFRGRNQAGEPDRQSLRYVVDAYLRALTNAVRDYDRRRILPLYLIFLDQHYYEANQARLWLDFLERPLGRLPRLPRDFADFEVRLRAAQDSLRSAVEASRLLAAEAREYGPEWLANQIKVQVSITNQADPSFRSREILPLLGVPDDIMRDHRKIAFYDVTEEDPYRGQALYTGMGIGEHYAGPTWEDRSIIAVGPMLVTLKGEARDLLLSQGVAPDRIPHPLRPRPRAVDYEERVQARIGLIRGRGELDQRGMELHNGTGPADKPINVAKAVLYSLMPPGSVIKAPDSLWGSDLLAALLAGSAFRGVRVLVIAPSLASAPSSGWPAMGLAHDLLARLIVLQQQLGPELEAGGGLLKTGIYSPGIGVDDVLRRFASGYRNARRTAFIRRLYPVHPDVDSLLSQAGRGAGQAPAPPGAALRAAEPAASPKLHLKATFLASREAWDSLVSGPEVRQVLEAYVAQLMEGPAGAPGGAIDAAQALTGASRQLYGAFESRLSPAERARVMYYLMVGSANQDYRSMFMDGEASVLISGWSTVMSMVDFSMLVTLSVWVDDLELLNSLLPPPSPARRAIARWIRSAL